jgi:hypothetical protein
MGLQLKISINCMVIEMGISDQPFQESYRRYHPWVTRSLAKRLWEKVDEYGVTIVLGIPDIKLPRKRDKWLMQEFVRMGFRTRELLLLNLVRIHQQVIFLSDILGRLVSLLTHATSTDTVKKRTGLLSNSPEKNRPSLPSDCGELQSGSWYQLVVSRIDLVSFCMRGTRCGSGDMTLRLKRCSIIMRIAWMYTGRSAHFGGCGK